MKNSYEGDWKNKNFTFYDYLLSYRQFSKRLFKVNYFENITDYTFGI